MENTATEVPVNTAEAETKTEQPVATTVPTAAPVEATAPVIAPNPDPGPITTEDFKRPEAAEPSLFQKIIRLLNPSGTKW